MTQAEADELRRLVREARQLASDWEALLNGVYKTATTPKVWKGSYASQSNRQFKDWKSELAKSADNLRDSASYWEKKIPEVEASEPGGGN